MTTVNQKLVRDALALSSGTIASLVDCTSYEIIDVVQREFVFYCEKHPEFETWVQAWNVFSSPDLRQVSNFITQPAASLPGESQKIQREEYEPNPDAPAYGWCNERQCYLIGHIIEMVPGPGAPQYTLPGVKPATATQLSMI